MKKLLFIIAAAGVLTAATGCNENNLATSSQVQAYLSDLYGRDFTYVATMRINDGSSAEDDLCYVYRDGDGLTCRAYMTRSSETWKYNITEDYQISYIKAHPELLSVLDGIGTSRDLRHFDSDVYTNAFSYLIYFDTYDSIETVVNGAADAVGSIPFINPSETVFVHDDISVISQRPCVEFVQSGAEESSCQPLYFRLGREPESGRDGIIADLQRGYVYGAEPEVPAAEEPSAAEDLQETTAAEEIAPESADEYGEYEWYDENDGCSEPEVRYEEYSGEEYYSFDGYETEEYGWDEPYSDDSSYENNYWEDQQ